MSSDTPFTRSGASSVKPLSEPEWWQLPADFDPEKVLAAARAQRDEVLGDWARAVGRSLAALWRKGIVEPYERWRQRERTIRELTMLEDHELRDLGITRSMIPFIASGHVVREDLPIRRDAVPANENTRSRKAA